MWWNTVSRNFVWVRERSDVDRNEGRLWIKVGHLPSLSSVSRGCKSTTHGLFMPILILTTWLLCAIRGHSRRQHHYSDHT